MKNNPKINKLRIKIENPKSLPVPGREAFRKHEWDIVTKYRTPRQVQKFLRGLRYNWEKNGETLSTFRGVVRRNTAHCLEGVLVAATILEQHGYPPWVLDIESQDNIDHVLFLFKHRGRYG